MEGYSIGLLAAIDQPVCSHFLVDGILVCEQLVGGIFAGNDCSIGYRVLTGALLTELGYWPVGYWPIGCSSPSSSDSFLRYSLFVFFVCENAILSGQRATATSRGARRCVLSVHVLWKVQQISGMLMTRYVRTRARARARARARVLTAHAGTKRRDGPADIRIDSDDSDAQAPLIEHYVYVYRTIVPERHVRVRVRSADAHACKCHNQNQPRYATERAALQLTGWILAAKSFPAIHARYGGSPADYRRPTNQNETGAVLAPLNSRRPRANQTTSLRRKPRGQSCAELVAEWIREAPRRGIVTKGCLRERSPE